MATVEGERVFLRKASGLIKSASNTDVFIYDIGLVSIGLGLGFLLFFGPAFYLGGNLYVATLIAGAAMLLIVILAGSMLPPKNCQVIESVGRTSPSSRAAPSDRLAA